MMNDMGVRAMVTFSNRGLLPISWEKVVKDSRVQGFK
jgi:hypothetical protein